MPVAGLVGCLVLFLLVASLESFTMYVLAKFAERYDAPSYGTLVRRALGKKTAAGLSAVTVVYLWGSSVAYLVRHQGGRVGEATANQEATVMACSWRPVQPPKRPMQVPLGFACK